MYDIENYKYLRTTLTTVYKNFATNAGIIKQISANFVNKNCVECPITLIEIILKLVVAFLICLVKLFNCVSLPPIKAFL